jgi:hypothetical protein
MRTEKETQLWKQMNGYLWSLSPLYMMVILPNLGRSGRILS